MNSKAQVKSILISIAENDEKAFTVFFRHYHVRLVRFALLIIPSVDLAEDVVSEVMVKLLKKRAEVFRMDNFEAYLYTAVKNQALNQLKKQKRFTLNPPSEDTYQLDIKFNSSPLDQVLAKELHQTIQCTINQLPSKRKMVFQLIKDEGLKHKEVAELLDISVKTVENHLDLALKDVRVKVKQYLRDKSEKVKPMVFKTLLVALVLAILSLI